METELSDLQKYVTDGMEARRSISISEILQLSRLLYERLQKGGKRMTYGNGGSAAKCCKSAAELSGRFLKERKSFPAIALSTNTSSITAIGNDYTQVFSRQLEGLCTKGDYVVGISTSGNSLNVVEGIRKAKEIGVFTLALTGKKGGKVKDLADHCVRVSSDLTPIIQEVHIAIIHTICYSFDTMLE